MKRLLIAGIFFIAIFFGIWLVAIPRDLIENLIEHSLQESGMIFDVRGLKKGVFYNFESEHLILKKADDTLLSIDNATGQINLLSLIMLRLPLRFSGSIAGGRIRGESDLLKGSNHVMFTVDNAEIEKIPAFALMGFTGSGVLSGEFKPLDNASSIRFAMKDLHFNPAVFGDLSIPLNIFRAGRGTLVIENDKIEIESFSLEGTGVYARIKGQITGKELNVNMELMPDKALVEKVPAFALIKTFEVSPGHYSIPLRHSIFFSALPTF